VPKATKESPQKMSPRAFKEYLKTLEPRDQEIEILFRESKRTKKDLRILQGIFYEDVLPTITRSNMLSRKSIRSTNFVDYYRSKFETK
jgi:hypothetical protein